MLSQHGSPTWQPRANACSKRASADSDVAEDEVDLAAERLRPRHERGHASRLDLFEGLVEEMDRVLDLAPQEVKATEQRERLTQRLARGQSPRARQCGPQQLAGRRVVPQIVPAGAPNQVDPGELLVVSGGELGGVGQRLLRSFVVRTQELHPADLAPSLRGDVELSDLLRERRSFVQRGGAFFVRAAGRVDERTPERDQRPGEELAIIDAPSGRHGPAQTVETGFDRAGSERRLTGLDLRTYCRRAPKRGPQTRPRTCRPPCEEQRSARCPARV